MQTLDLKRFQAVPGDALAELLRKYSDILRFQMNKKQAQIARESWLDESAGSAFCSRSFTCRKGAGDTRR